jgi:DNA-binding transcriptional LysR family regulator
MRRPALPGIGRGQVVRRERPVWAASRHHAIADPVPLALSLDGCMFREWAIAAMDAAGRKWRLAYMSPSHAAVEAAVAAGLAVSVFKAGTVAHGLRLLRPRDGFKRLPAVDIVLHRAPEIRNQAPRVSATCWARRCATDPRKGDACVASPARRDS